MANLATKIITSSFYLLFLLVPLWFYAGSAELFEYNKMMLTYGLTVIIATAWLIKIIGNWKLEIGNFRRTPLDIPILLYLLAHILSTIFSLDPHTSIWGYYSRFHEGLLATISYIILYYAAVSNLSRQNVIRILLLSFISASIISIYGAFEHFGHSPSCLFITGNFNVDCWVQDVKNRVFATLGQPNWMAAYLDIVLLSVLGFLFSDRGLSVFSFSVADKQKTGKLTSDNRQLKTDNRKSILYFCLISPLFSALLFTKSRSGILGLAAGLAIFTLVLFLKEKKKLLTNRFLILSSLLFLLSSLAFGLPFSQTEKFSLENFLTNKSAAAPPSPSPLAPSPYIDIGISESGDIRRIVWQGAIKIWQRYPIFGSGVETFAYAYYKDRPVAHNLVSEWDFLYNKAHNEFLNILATTGTVGMLAYLSILGVFALWFIRSTVNPALPAGRREPDLLVSALFAAYISILVTNFFGFSVVVIGLFFFLIPAFCFILASPEQSSNETMKQSLSPSRISLICLIGLIALIIEWNLVSMWLADRDYAYGKNLDLVQHFADAYKYLANAVSTNPNEPTFRDELSYNQSVLASSLYTQIQSATDSAVASLSAQQKLTIQIPQLGVSTSDLIQQSIDNSNKVVETSPNALTFWKTRTKVFYQLATIDNKYILDALTAIEKAAELAPTDAKVHYNLGILLGRAGQITAAISALEETTKLKPDYRDAYYALGLYYKETGDKASAKARMQYILSHIGPDEPAQKFLNEN